VAGVVPGKHTTRQGWLTKDFHYPQSPFTSDLDEPVWRARDGRTMSLRTMAHQVAWYFRRSIRRYSDPFSFRLLFAVLSGRAPSLLELRDRPGAYEDVGRLCRWGIVLPALTARATGEPAGRLRWSEGSFEEFLQSREREREQYLAQPGLGPAPAAERPAPAPARRRRRSAADERVLRAAAPSRPRRTKKKKAAAATPDAPPPPEGAVTGPPPPGAPTLSLSTVRAARLGLRPVAARERRTAAGNGAAPRPRAKPAAERRKAERRTQTAPIPFPDRRLTRSAYERVFLKLVSGGKLRIGRETYTPIGMKGWYQAIFKRDSDGRERVLTIDQLLERMDSWER
jgi:hypothetical protein